MVQIADIPPAVARAYGVRVADLTGRSLQRLHCEARQLAMWIARHHTAASLADIGRLLGGRAAETVRHGVIAVEQQLNAGEELRLFRDLALALSQGRHGEAEREALARFQAAATDEATIAAGLERQEIRVARAMRLAERALERDVAKGLEV